VGGVGYAVNMPSAQAIVGDKLQLYVHTAVRQDDISLWGFRTMAELRMFELLLSVSGVGLKTAISLIDKIGVNGIIRTILSESAPGLKAPGIGTKTAERIVVDLKSKIAEMQQSGGAEGSSKESVSNEVLIEVHSALEALGYKPHEVARVLSQIDSSRFKDTQGLVKEVLRQI
jgi:Holliday junction DNA helicase RuvA